MGKTEKSCRYTANETVTVSNLSERQDLDRLREEFKNSTEQWKQKESRSLHNQERLKKRVCELEIRTRELLDEVKILEKERALFVARDNVPLEKENCYAKKHQNIEQVSNLTTKSKHIFCENPSETISQSSVKKPLTDHSVDIKYHGEAYEISKMFLDKLQEDLELGKCIDVDMI
jgi:hypothetical protein